MPDRAEGRRESRSGRESKWRWCRKVEGRQIVEREKMCELTVLLGIRREQTLASFRAMTLQFWKIFGIRRGSEFGDRSIKSYRANSRRTLFRLILFYLNLLMQLFPKDNIPSWQLCSKYNGRMVSFSSFPFSMISSLISFVQLQTMRSCMQMCILHSFFA